MTQLAERMSENETPVAPVRPHPASFRYPAGYIFSRDGVIYRQINDVARKDYERLLTSGLYAALEKSGDLVPHEEVDRSLSPDGLAYRVIRPDRIHFISYPYEWSFSQLKDA